MTKKLALYVRLDAKPGKDAALDAPAHGKEGRRPNAQAPTSAEATPLPERMQRAPKIADGGRA